MRQEQRRKLCYGIEKKSRRETQPEDIPADFPPNASQARKTAYNGITKPGKRAAKPGSFFSFTWKWENSSNPASEASLHVDYWKNWK